MLDHFDFVYVFFCQGSHTEAAYSTKGRSYVLYADSFSLGLLVWMLRLINFNELLVFIVIWLICFDHDKSREILSPKYLAESVSFRLTSWRV